MNRYPFWKNLLIVVVILFSLIYTIPNFYGEEPAIQISPSNEQLQIDDKLIQSIKQTLEQQHIQAHRYSLEKNNLRLRLDNTDIQLQAKDVIEQLLNKNADDPDYTVALNLLPAAPNVFTNFFHALPMYLGLDLRGGIHFLMEVDMQGAINSHLNSLSADLRTQLRDKKIRYGGIQRQADFIEIRIHDEHQAQLAQQFIAKNNPELTLTQKKIGDGFVLRATLALEAQKSIQESALAQNINTLHNRINELGVAEPVIQQQGADRIVVELPGVQDVAKAKEIIGRTATLEMHMVNDDVADLESAISSGVAPYGTTLYSEKGSSRPILLFNPVLLTGERLTNAQPGFDQNSQPAVNLTLDATGSRIFRDITRDSIGKRIAIVLIENNKGEVVTAPVIRDEIGGGRVQISGAMTTTQANDISLLLRSGSLAAPMKIIEERTIGPTMGADNISKGFHSTLWGFVAIAVFMIIYYHLFGITSVVALVTNLLLLIAILSVMQATLTLPGIAAIALTLGMAIDANVLINERIREELHRGTSPQAAIHAGYDHAFNTILDANVTTLIAGVALLIFGTGAVRGFAVVHCIGVLTSMFTSVLVSRMLVNLIYGRRRKLTHVSIG